MYFDKKKNLDGPPSYLIIFLKLIKFDIKII